MAENQMGKEVRDDVLPEYEPNPEAEEARLQLLLTMFDLEDELELMQSAARELEEAWRAHTEAGKDLIARARSLKARYARTLYRYQTIKNFLSE
jgi:hypothetical protein